MPKEDTQFSSTNQPKGRGRSKKTLILDALRKQAFQGLSAKATTEECERAWFSHLVSCVIDPENKDSGLCLRLITERGWAAIKPSSELVTFDFDPSASATQKAEQILKAVSDGIVPMDYGERFISAINSTTNIEANTELKAEIERIKEKLGLE